MSALDHVTRPPGSRALGLRVKPTLRLAMGYRDAERKGAPVKTDYFVAKQGQDGVNARAAEKFTSVYGDKPRAVEIMLPAELRQALTITYKAWGSSGDDEGGVLKAIGSTNFALEEYVGGPDVLTVWNPDGEVEEIEVSGLDDPAAKELGLELYTTFRFGIPSVLGFGSFAEISSRGKETTDNLWTRLGGLYALFGMRATYAVKPQLVIRPSSVRPVVVKDGQAKRIKSAIFVLDLVVTETIDDMLDRVRERAALLPGSPSDAIYGPRAKLPAAPVEENGTGPADTAGEAAGQQAEAAVEDTPPPPAASVPDDDAALEAEFESGDKAAADAAGNFVLPEGTHKGKTVFQVAAGAGGEKRIKYLLKSPSHKAHAAALAFASHYLPELIVAAEQEARAAKEVAA